MFRASHILQGEDQIRSAAEFFPVTSVNYAVDGEAYLGELLQLADPGPDGIGAIRRNARALIETVRSWDNAVDTLDALLRQYNLDTQGDLMPVCLAEALLRVPDATTADALIRDELPAANWQRHLDQSDNVLVNFAAWSLVMIGKVVNIDERTDGRAPSVISRLMQHSGEPVIRAAMNQAMKPVGRRFVLGQTISEALKSGRPYREQGYTHSFDMLSEAALTAADAERYTAGYRRAIDTVGAKPQVGPGPRPSISVKLSALHPRYEVAQRERMFSELFANVLEPAVRARRLSVSITINAEGADRLELSLELYERLVRDPAIAGWGEFDLVIRAYSKRCLPVLVWLTLFDREPGTRIPLRPVKGAYWDSEIRQCQVQGADGYPVYTRKEGIDTSYLTCTRYLLSKHTHEVIYPQFVSHNAHTVTTILTLADGARAAGGEGRDFEFQRLHGMGDALYDTVIEKYRHDVCIYAPIGAHKDLLPYLVRCLLENGTNSSFVHRLVDPRVPIETLIQYPVARLCQFEVLANDRIPLPQAIFDAGRKNSQGIGMNIRNQWNELELTYRLHLTRQWRATPVVNGEKLSGPVHEMRCPYDLERLVGSVQYASAEQTGKALDVLQATWPRWSATPMDEHADILERLADLLEAQHGELMALCILEAGKSLQDGIDEIREAVDFYRYYAQQARQRLVRRELRGPAGKRNKLFYEGRDIFTCTSPWNFPLAIFLDQINAALVAGSTVLAKPAEQTNLIAACIVELIFEAGLPKDIIALLPGDGATLGGVFYRDARAAGVIFAGPTDTTHIINRQPAEKPGAIATLIAETGRQNVMIVGSTALPERVIRDAVQFAFTSVGQCCSALRVMYVQQDAAERVIELFRGAVAELKVDPTDVRVGDIGPMIDAEAKAGLEQRIAALKAAGKLIAETKVPDSLSGHFVAPVTFETSGIDELKKGNFDPVLRMVRYATQDPEKVVQAINATDFDLTMGVHSRNGEIARHIEELARVGNLYINRDQIDAVMGVQPLGDHGLSGIGPKAGGPDYLLRFISERTTSVNTTAVGGNTSLLSLTDTE